MKDRILASTLLVTMVVALLSLTMQPASALAAPQITPGTGANAVLPAWFTQPGSPLSTLAAPTPGNPTNSSTAVSAPPDLSSVPAERSDMQITGSSASAPTDSVQGLALLVHADMALTKTSASASVAADARLIYTLTVVNNGFDSGEDVVVTDTLPSEVTFVDATQPHTYDAPTVSWALGTMSRWETRVLTVEVTVAPGVTEAFTNGACVGSSTADSNPSNNCDSIDTSLLVPAIQVVKWVDRERTGPDEPFTYTLRVTNTGGLVLDPVTLTDTLPVGLSYVAGSAAPVEPDLVAEPVLAWDDLGLLAPGGSLTVTFQVTAPISAVGLLTNTVTATGRYPGGTVTDTDEAEIEIVRPAVMVRKALVSQDTDDLFPNYITFTIAITNVGLSQVDVLPLDDIFDPEYLYFVSASPVTPDMVSNATGLVSWYDLTSPAPHGFGMNLEPGRSFVLTTVFTVASQIVTTTNTAVVSDVVDVYENPAEEDDDTVIIVDVPTAVDLLYFRVAQATSDAVTLEWATAVEQNTYGFALYRAATPDMDRAGSVGFILSQGHGGPASYSFTDRDQVSRSDIWYYWLAEIENSGKAIYHGPASTSAWQPAALTERTYLPMVMR